MEDPKRIVESIEIAGRTLSLETGRLAHAADGAVVATYGETVVLATVVVSDPREDADFFPLLVDYEEKLYAGGLIKGSRFIKREGRPRDEAILGARVIDRSIRPLFPKDFKNEVQVVVTVLSVDKENDPVVVGLIATSAALTISGVPWKGPISGVRIGHVEGKYIVNPLSSTEMGYSTLDLIVASSKERVVMIEAGAEQLPEESFIQGMEVGFASNTSIIEFIQTFASKCTITPIEYEAPVEDTELISRIESYIREHFDFYANETKERGEARAERENLKTDMFVAFEGKTTKSAMVTIFDTMRKKEIRRLILEEGKRLDGRAVDEIRPLFMQVGLLPRTHGSAIFQRGDTQAVTVTTLGSTSLEQSIESMHGEETKRYIHHYNFPPFATGEVGRLGGTGRREIGHGALAERALEPVIPSEEQFPYTIRVVSEIFASNGSSSMASTCGSTLSLMDAGVPIKEPVSGIAMGLVTEGDKEVILSDILGVEDMAGDMDFKVTGTKNGITAIQVDVKTDGLTIDFINKTLEQAKTGRMFILEQMLTIIEKPRQALSQYAPKVTSLKISVDKIGEVIGPGGKVIKAIQQDTATVIAIEEDGTVYISGTEEEGIQAARKRVEGITQEPEIGATYDGTVKRVVDFGAFVEYLPGKEGLVHISEISNGYVEKVTDYLHEGDSVRVKLVEIDDRGRVNLSIRALLEQE